jgi:hypothetical protein
LGIEDRFDPIHLIEQLLDAQAPAELFDSACRVSKCLGASVVFEIVHSLRELPEFVLRLGSCEYVSTRCEPIVCSDGLEPDDLSQAFI